MRFRDEHPVTYGLGLIGFLLICVVGIALVLR
jgi:hypothetical protein